VLDTQASYNLIRKGKHKKQSDIKDKEWMT